MNLVSHFLPTRWHHRALQISCNNIREKKGDEITGIFPTAAVNKASNWRNNNLYHCYLVSWVLLLYQRLSESWTSGKSCACSNHVLPNIYSQVVRIITFFEKVLTNQANSAPKGSHTLFLFFMSEKTINFKILQCVLVIIFPWLPDNTFSVLKKRLNHRTRQNLRGYSGLTTDLMSWLWFWTLSKRFSRENRGVSLLTLPGNHGLLVCNMSTLLLSKLQYQILTTQCRCWQAPRFQLSAAKSHHGIHPRHYLSSCFACSGFW